MTIGVGIVGYGYAGRNFHSYLLKFAPELRLVAVASRDPERRERAAREHPGIKTFKTLEEMLRDGAVQLVILATPHNVHCAQAVRALSAGRHVVTDKVMCLDTREADRMIAVARKHKRLLSVFHNRRWDGDFLTVRKVLAEGKLLGKLAFAEAAVLSFGTPRNWRASKEAGGGILYDWGAHLVDQALLLGGAPVESVTGFAQFNRSDQEVETYACAQIRFANGVLYSVECSNQAAQPKPRWYVAGRNGALVKTGLDPQEAYMNRGEIENACEDPQHRARVRTLLKGQWVELSLETERGDWRQFYQNIADVLIRKKELAVKPEQIRRVVAVLNAFDQSVARRGAPVRPDGERGPFLIAEEPRSARV